MAESPSEIIISVVVPVRYADEFEVLFAKAALEDETYYPIMIQKELWDDLCEAAKPLDTSGGALLELFITEGLARCARQKDGGLT